MPNNDQGAAFPGEMLKEVCVLSTDDNVLCLVIDVRNAEGYKRHSVKLTLSNDAHAHARLFVKVLQQEI